MLEIQGSREETFQEVPGVCVGYFLSQLEKKPTGEGALLDLLLANRDVLAGAVMVEGLLVVIK